MRKEVREGWKQLHNYEFCQSN